MPVTSDEDGYEIPVHGRRRRGSANPIEPLPTAQDDSVEYFEEDALPPPIDDMLRRKMDEFDLNINRFLAQFVSCSFSCMSY